MKVLLIGNGGREHAIAWKLKNSPSVEKVICPNGNPGIAIVAETPSLEGNMTPADWAEYAKKMDIDLVTVGPEAPLAEGVSDACLEAGLKVFGPTKAAAQIEASKSFSKEIMEAAGIPTARSGTFSDPDKALAFAKELGIPVVVKADGLAAGKGVAICETHEDLEKAIQENLVDNRFGDSSQKILIEEFLHGEEASILAFCDGKDVFPLVPSQDHKRAFDEDKGPNTGGMGTYAPAPIVTEEILSASLSQVLRPCVEEMAKRGTPYIGVLYAGLMIHPEGGLKVLEFNCRFGDPETQVVLPLLDGDLGEIMLACANGELTKYASGMMTTSEGKPSSIAIKPQAAVCVVQASGGYPGSYEKGKVIKGLDQITAEDEIVFHAGTKAGSGGEVLTNGGRVIGLTAIAADFEAARAKAYKMAEVVTFDDVHMRTDIGYRALKK